MAFTLIFKDISEERDIPKEKELVEEIQAEFPNVKSIIKNIISKKLIWHFGY